MRMKDGSIAYSLKDLEHYEVAVCRDPAVPLALITEFNTLAKAAVDGVDLGGGRMLIKCDKFGCYVDKREESHQAEQVELDQAIGNIRGQTPTQNTTRRFKIGRGGARFAPKAPQSEPYKGYKTAGNEAGLKAPEARNEALVYDDKTHDQPSETPEENQAKVQKGKNPRNVEAGYRVHTDTGESAGSCDAKCQRKHGIRCTINGCEKILPERMGEVREHWAEHDHESKFLQDDHDKLRERMGKQD